jgi:hypothetical protein
MEATMHYTPLHRERLILAGHNACIIRRVTTCIDISAVRFSF